LILLRYKISRKKLIFRISNKTLREKFHWSTNSALSKQWGRWCLFYCRAGFVRGSRRYHLFLLIKSGIFLRYFLSYTPYSALDKSSIFFLLFLFNGPSTEFVDLKKKCHKLASKDRQNNWLVPKKTNIYLLQIWFNWNVQSFRHQITRAGHLLLFPLFAIRSSATSTPLFAIATPLLFQKLQYATRYSLSLLLFHQCCGLHQF
jgi:hypothetical protein